ncbi:copper resistance protein CopC [Actinotalea sp. AC32]|nr:copper resistance protein CopC [Actinotalea sp. AC32]
MRPRPLPSSGPRGRRSLVLLLGLVLAVVAPLPALAHDSLVGSEPADGAVVETAPAQVVLTFSSTQLDVGAAVTVTGPDGREWADGAPRVEDERVVQPLATGMAAGAYAVQWRSVSGDGHPVTGTFAFEVAAAATDPAGPSAAPEPVPTQEAAEEPGDPASVPGPSEPAGATDEADGDDVAAGGGSEASGADPSGPARRGPAGPVGVVVGVALLALAAWTVVRRRGSGRG